MIRAFQAAVVVVGAATGFGVCVGCSAASERATEQKATAAQSAAPVQQAPVPAPVTVSASASASEAAQVVAPPAKPVSKGPAAEARASALQVKRLVVTTGVRDREPLAGDAALVSDGSAIYAFAELSNDGGGTENVRITFERKGGKEKVGDVSLPVPANVARHRTWAFTRFIRVAGVWEAVVWSETGAELSRTSFEVG